MQIPGSLKMTLEIVQNVTCCVASFGELKLMPKATTNRDKLKCFLRIG
uniref:Uncharacterized protein n=1 Tax=Ascaris lumbricoides TaxID=6252 RepID=A0A0M3HLJ4_ASCLU